MNFKDVIAHTSEVVEDGQSLEEHLLTVAENARRGSIFPATSYLLGLLHDLGKSDPLWQRYIRDGKGKVNHSSAGARWVNDNVEGNAIYKGILSYVITAHHGYYDSIFEDTVRKKRIPTLEGRRLQYDKEDGYSYKDTVKYFNTLISKNDIDIQALISSSKEEFNSWVKAELGAGINQNVFMYRVGLYIRYLLSVLKDADIIDTVTWDRRELVEEGMDTSIRLTQSDAWEEVDRKIESMYAGFTIDTDINAERSRMANDILTNGGELSSGVVKIDMATGTGKTLASLRYAVKQARRFNKKRILYITPYLSVLEQNAQVIRNAVGNDDFILEHHSNMVEDDEGVENKKSEFLKDNWDSPFVLTTMVQLFNTFFKGGSSNIRRFKALEDSIIIIDEIQSLPPDKISMVNGALNELALTYNSLIITCTATQPELGSEYIYEPLVYTKVNGSGDLVEDTELSKEIFTRTKDEVLLDRQLSTDELADKVEEDVLLGKNVLVILDLKKAVSKLTDELSSRGVEVIYLTTNLCAEHRLDLINTIKEKLSREESFVVVSTQLIEAGVDVDFKVVYRNVIGMDRLIQARGRCNREGKLDYGEMRIVDYEENNLNIGTMRELKVGQDVSRTLLQGFKDKSLDELIPRYYANLYKNKLGKSGTKGTLSGDLKDTTLYDMLALNKYLVNGVKVTMPQYFKTAYNNANLIEEGGFTVIVPYGDGAGYAEILLEYYNHANMRGIKDMLKKLQRYTVTYYNANELEGKGEYLGDLGVFILSSEYYGEKGIDLGKDMGTLIL